MPENSSVLFFVPVMVVVPDTKTVHDSCFAVTIVILLLPSPVTVPVSEFGFFFVFVPVGVAGEIFAKEIVGTTVGIGETVGWPWVFDGLLIFVYKYAPKARISSKAMIEPIISFIFFTRIT